MKRNVLMLLAAALIVSLWFNWRNRPAVANVGGVPAVSASPAEPVMHAKVEEMDFSGTGLADEAWQLQPPGLNGQIPTSLPGGEDEKSPEQKVPHPVPDSWEPEAKLKLDTRPP